MKSNLTHLHEYLFEQLERISNDDLAGEELKEEIERTRAMTNVTNSIVANGRLILDAHRFKDNKLGTEELPALLDGDSNE